jgi:YVTN family beta-propeller protein
MTRHQTDKRSKWVETLMLRWGSLLLAALVIGCSPNATPPATAPSDARTLNTGKDLVPPTTQPDTLGNLPMTMAATADGKYLVVCGMGYKNAVCCVSTATGKTISQIDFKTKRPTKIRPQNGVESNAGEAAAGKTNGVYWGIAVSGNQVFVGQGAHDSVAVLSISPDGKLTTTGSIAADPNDFPAGVAADDAGHLFVVDNGIGDDFSTPAGLTVFDRATGKKLSRYTFETPNGLSTFPLAITADPAGKRVFVTGERDGVVYDFNTADPTHPILTNTIPTGSHPVALLPSADRSKLFVANAQSDTISVIDTATDKVAATVLLRPGTSRGLPGVTPTGLALSTDGKQLFVTLGDMNAVAVVDVATANVTGLLPAGWYPAAAIFAGDHLLVLNAKGSTIRLPNPMHQQFTPRFVKEAYSLDLVVGDLQTVPIPTGPALAAATASVLHANRLDDPSRQSDNPLQAIGLSAGKIKHVIYIVKENRTYDQLLGDDPRGNGDPALALFGKDVTPNLHALADRFVLLDNCFACGEVSGDGWTWSTQGIANPYTIRNVPYHYSGRGRDYDFEGENAGYITGGFPAMGIDGKPNSDDPRFKNGAPAVPDMAAANTHLWDIARAAHLTIRNFGFFLSSADVTPGQQVMPACYPTVPGLRPPGHNLAGITNPDFPGFDLDYPDSDAPGIYFKQTKDRDCLYKQKVFGLAKSPSRISEWRREFDQMIAADPTGNAVPALMLVRLPHDHTQGLSAGKHTPRSEVADNDYAVGQMIDTLSHSAVWSSTAVFIVEDDAQAGPDHVDCHRMPALVISPWIKAHSVDHRFNNTDTILKTMECLLGLPPMSQYDAIALPIDDFDNTASNAEPYTAILPAKQIIADVTSLLHIGATDPAKAQLIADSSRMDFSHADRAPADQLNRIIWQSVRGTGSVMPPPRNTLESPVNGVKVSKVKDDDDD